LQNNESVLLNFSNSELIIIVLTTTPDAEEAKILAKKIVAAKLAACVQIMPRMKSYYFWEGKVQNNNENLMIIKTFKEKFAHLEKFIQANHSYDVPEIVGLSAEQVSNSYLNWMTNFLA